MKLSIKAILSVIIVVVGFYVGTFIFVSKTEQIISWIYLIGLVVVIVKPKLQSIFYILAAISITLATFLYVIGPTMVRYSHYIDKLSLWSYYFFGTAIFLSAIEVLRRKKL